MTLGVGTFFPQGQFYVTRSYMKEVVVRVDANAVVMNQETISFVDPNNPNVFFVMVLDTDFYQWSTNKRSLDHMVVESYYYVFPDLTQLPMSFDLRYNAGGAAPVPNIELVPFGLAFTTRWRFPLPGTAQPYWADGTQN